jgi:hypothetical protein
MACRREGRAGGGQRWREGGGRGPEVEGGWPDGDGQRWRDGGGRGPAAGSSAAAAVGCRPGLPAGGAGRRAARGAGRRAAAGGVGRRAAAGGAGRRAAARAWEESGGARVGGGRRRGGGRRAARASRRSGRARGRAGLVITLAVPTARFCADGLAVGIAI